MTSNRDEVEEANQKLHGKHDLILRNSVLNNLIFFHLPSLTVLGPFTILFRSSELIAQLRSENISLREKLEETEEKLEVT